MTRLRVFSMTAQIRFVIITSHAPISSFSFAYSLDFEFSKQGGLMWNDHVNCNHHHQPHVILLTCWSQGLQVKVWRIYGEGEQMP